MGKLVPFHTTMDVEMVSKEVKIGGVVSKSNFMPEDERHMFPLHEPVFDKIGKGDKIRVTIFADEDEVEREGGRTSFRPLGVRYEIWNQENEGWDKLFEQMKPVEK